MWEFECACGNSTIARGSAVTTRNTKSCGCWNVEQRRRNGHNKIHGKSHSPEYQAYQSARKRCTVPSNPSYQVYRARGVQFLFDSFESFYAELGPRPSPKHSVDRIDTRGHYESGNVRWATLNQQGRNRLKMRPKCSSRYKGVCWVRGRWRAMIRVNGRNLFLGLFGDEETAARIYDEAARKYYGEFACPNFPVEATA
jgi:hypothetical protein